MRTEGSTGRTSTVLPLNPPCVKRRKKYRSSSLQCLLVEHLSVLVSARVHPPEKETKKSKEAKGQLTVFGLAPEPAGGGSQWNSSHSFGISLALCMSGEGYKSRLFTALYAKPHPKLHSFLMSGCQGPSCFTPAASLSLPLPSIGSVTLGCYRS